MDFFTDWIIEKSNQNILMKLLENIKKALEFEINYLKITVKTCEAKVDYFRREGNNQAVDYYLVSGMQFENLIQILAACKFTLERLISQFKPGQTFPGKKLANIASILYQLSERYLLDDKLTSSVQNFQKILRQFKFGQELEKPFQIEYYKRSFLEEDILGKGISIQNILKKMLKADPDIRGVILLDNGGKILAYHTKFSIQRGALENFGKNVSKMIIGCSKFGAAFNLGEYHWTRSEFTKEGKMDSKDGVVTIFPVGTHLMCIIGGYCPNIGMVHMIMQSVREELTKILEYL